MSNKYYAVYQSGGAIYGVGETREAAIEEARQWVDDGETLDEQLVERPQANTGDMIIAECSVAVFIEVSAKGGDIAFNESEDIIRLYSEIK